MGARRITGALMSAGLLMVPTSVSHAQERPAGGLTLTFDVGTTLRAHRNIDLDPADPGPTYRSDTNLGIGLTSETRTQSLALSFGTVFRAEDGPGGSSADLEDYRASLAYSLEMARSRLSFDSAYVQTEVNGFSQVFDPGLGTTALVSDDGTRGTYRADASLAFGTAGPFGLTLSFGVAGVDYRNTLDPSLFDSQTLRGTLGTELAFSPQVTGTAELFVSRYEAEDAPRTQRDTQALTFGLRYQINPITELGVTAGARRIDSSTDGVSEAAEAGIRVTRTLPRGSLSAAIDTTLTEVGRRDRIAVTRAFTFPTSVLTITVGAIDVPRISPVPTVDIGYSHDFARGTLSATLSRDVSIDTQANVQEVLSAGLDYTHLLDSRSQVVFGLDYLDLNDVRNTGVVERERTSFSATYRREVLRDWQLSAGYERRILTEAGTGTVTDDAVFLTLNRQFSVRP